MEKEESVFANTKSVRIIQSGNKCLRNEFSIVESCKETGVVRKVRHYRQENRRSSEFNEMEQDVSVPKKDITFQ